MKCHHRLRFSRILCWSHLIFQKLQVSLFFIVKHNSDVFHSHVFILTAPTRLTRQAGRHVDLCVEPLVGQQLWHSIQGLHSERVIGVGKKVDHSHSSFCQADLLRHESNARPAWLTLPPDALPAAHAVGQVHPAPGVRRSSPVQDQRGLLQCVDQVSGWGRGACERKKLSYFGLFFIPGNWWITLNVNWYNKLVINVLYGACSLHITAQQAHNNLIKTIWHEKQKCEAIVMI